MRRNLLALSLIFAFLLLVQFGMASRVERPLQAAEGAIGLDAGQRVLRYEVQPGDTLFGLARRFLGQGHQWGAIAELNPGLTPSTLRVGREILIPLPEGAPSSPATDPRSEAPPEEIGLLAWRLVRLGEDPRATFRALARLRDDLVQEVALYPATGDPALRGRPAVVIAGVAGRDVFERFGLEDRTGDGMADLITVWKTADGTRFERVLTWRDGRIVESLAPPPESPASPLPPHALRPLDAGSARNRVLAARVGERLALLAR